MACGSSSPTGQCGFRSSRFPMPTPTALRRPVRSWTSSVRLRRFPSPPPIRCGVAVTALRRRDHTPGFVVETSSRPDRGGECRRRHWSVPTAAHSCPAGKRIRILQAHASRIQRTGAVAAGRGAGRRRRCLRRADRRGAAPCRPPRLSLRRPAPPPAALVSRSRRLIWWLGHARPGSDAGGEAADRKDRCR